MNSEIDRHGADQAPAAAPGNDERLEGETEMAELKIRPRPNPLPETVTDLEARQVFRLPTLNDRVDTLHKRLWSNAKYRAYLDAVYDEDAVEGSLSADNIFAALMIREEAKGDGADPYVASKKVATIAKALVVVCNRYRISRKYRAHEVAGEYISDNSNGN